MGEPRFYEAWQELLAHVGIPNDARLRIQAHLDGEQYVPKGPAGGGVDPRDAEIARLTAALAAKNSPPEAAPAPTESPVQAEPVQESLSEPSTPAEDSASVGATAEAPPDTDAASVSEQAAG